MREFSDINAFLLEFKRFMQIAMILDWSDGTVQCANSFHLMTKSVLYCSTFMTDQQPHSRYTPEYINKNICLNLINNYIKQHRALSELTMEWNFSLCTMC